MKGRRSDFSVGAKVHVRVPERDRLSLPAEFHEVTLPIRKKIKFGNQGFIYELDGAVSKKNVPFWFAEDWLSLK